MPVEAQPPTYQTCAVMGGAQLAGGSLVDLGKAQFSFKPANCSYSSEPSYPPHTGHLRMVAWLMPFCCGRAYSGYLWSSH